jgi:hypothetical protein
MVTFKNQGRLGNFLFQAATAYAYALKHNQEFTVPTTTNDPYWNPLYLQHLAKPLPPNKPTVIIRERGHQFQELLPLPHSISNIILEGYFQSEKYFKDYRKEVLKAFNLKWEPAETENIVSVHVRRGDYLKYPHKHPPVTVEYYKAAMEKIKELTNKDRWQFLFFSDDIQWCKDNFKGPWYSFSDVGLSPIEDLEAISWCRHHINSSSTFAWWGAWLNQNPNKIVITPKLWFVPGHGGLDTSDIIPESWIKI